jgi:hypothetical protein
MRQGERDALKTLLEDASTALIRVLCSLVCVYSGTGLLVSKCYLQDEQEYQRGNNPSACSNTYHSLP